MAPEVLKRPADATHDLESPRAKRQRTIPPSAILTTGPIGSSPLASHALTTNELARKGLRRGIALALQKVGFDSATPDAMEGFTSMVETYLESLVEDIKTYSNAARRSHAIPRDFELTLRRFNLTTSALQPHRKPPIPRSKRLPAWQLLPDDDDSFYHDLPILGEELDGAADKAAKPYIPGSFPAFPSIHTYKYTPESVEAATVSDDWGVFNPDMKDTAAGAGSSQPIQRPLAPEEIPRGDAKKMREAAAKEAKAGEGALRRLMRASKIAKQKEVWAASQRHPARRDRYRLWEGVMRELIEDDAAKTKGKEVAAAALHGDRGRVEIADHSMIVNSDQACFRQEVPRGGARKAAAVAAGHGLNGLTGKG